MSANACDGMDDLLNSAVSGKLNEYSVKINDFNDKEGFSGDIIFITLTNKETKQNKCIVIKQPKLIDGIPLKASELTFNNETHFYETMWPTLQHFYRDKTDELFDVVPKCYATSKKNMPRIALEDLVAAKFSLFDKTKPLDDDHFSFIFNTYGIYHGISMALKQLDVEKYNELLAPTKSIWDNGFTKECYTAKMMVLLTRIFEEYFRIDTEKHLIAELQNYHGRGVEILDECLRSGRIGGVMLHGDCWSNNFMFRYDENGKVQEMKMLDFQIITSGSPVFDLSHCLYAGGAGESFDKLDTYLEIYHSSLSNTLKKFGLDAENVYSFGTFKDEWKKYSKYGFAIGMMMWTLKLTDTKKMKDFTDDDLEGAADIQIPEILEEMKDFHKQTIRELILHMYTRGFL